GTGGALKLVMQHGASLDTGTKKDDLSDEEVAERYEENLGSRLDLGWAPVTGPDRLFDNSYHIKVAVRDDKSFWLSSGNWQSSNQPKILATPPPEDSAPLRKYNREWHAVIENATLAKRFAAHIGKDLEE